MGILNQEWRIKWKGLEMTTGNTSRFIRIMWSSHKNGISLSGVLIMRIIDYSILGSLLVTPV